MNKNTLIDSIRTAVQRNRLKQALTLLKKLTQQHHHPTWKNTATTLSSRLSSVKQQEINGLIDFKEANQEKNKINHAILNLLDIIETGEEASVGGFGNSRSIRQEHSGGGDNVAGNKTVNYNANPSSNSGHTKLGLWLVGIVLIAILTVIMVNLFTGSKNTSNVTIKARPMGNYELPEKGEIILNFGSDFLDKTIGSQGEVYFPEISKDYFDESSKVRITFNDPENEPFKAVYPDSLYQLESNSTIDLWVELTGLDKMYGIVKDFKTGNAIEGVRVSILNLEVYTDKNGWFELKIPAAQQRKFHTVRATIDGYQPYEVGNVPAQTDKEMSILLKRE